MEISSRKRSASARAHHKPAAIVFNRLLQGIDSAFNVSTTTEFQ